MSGFANAPLRGVMRLELENQKAKIYYIVNYITTFQCLP